MATLPSYQDAISRLDWLELVASYIEDKDLASLCSVNRRFYAVFASRLWNDPLVAVRRLGLDPSDGTFVSGHARQLSLTMDAISASKDLEWYLRFVFDRMRCTRLSTLALITTLDFRDFAKDIAHFSSDNTTRTIPETLRILPRILPNLRCILLDGHVEADPAFLTTTPPSEAGTAPSGRSQGLLALSVAHCQTQLPNGFFSSDRLQHLVYLDVSGLPGSLQPLVVAAQRRRTLNCLRILKARRREINDALALALFKAFKSSLWSLDVCENNITDGILDQFATLCFNSPSLRSQSRFTAEGKLVFDGQGNDAYGRFMSIQESNWSGTFSHPERHFVDAPAYCADASRVLQEDEAVRTNGRTPLRRDSVDHVKAAIAGSMDQAVPDWSDVPYLDVCTAPAGITHLHLSDNRVTTSGLERLIRSSQGQLEELSCDSPLFQPVHGSAAAKQHFPWPGNVKLRGALGCAHVFRPVFSSNLRVLCIHHSLVTQIPTLEADGLSTMARLWLAETTIRERSERAFPPAFEPDMNPRLTSLTLTKIPRRSFGPLIDKLLHFLKLMGLQEYAIQETAHSVSRRSPVLLRGLRHLRLEFEADPIEDPTGFSTVEDLDAEGLMNMGGGEGFSFFGGERPQSRTSAEASSKKQATVGDGLAVRPPKITAGRLAEFPYSEVGPEYMRYSDTWGERQINREVWVGTGILGTNHAINEYMRLVLHPSLRSRVGPATPAHVKAGVPEGALLFHAAWDATVMPLELKPPRTTELHGMRDVLEAIKRFRVETRTDCETAKRAAVEGMAGPRHFFWTGRLEVSAQQSMGHYRAPSYWR
ncbi:leucine rich repeat domain containing protein [Colletotrichum incanum]|uniref:Leucine rich repeat domain containing protein n=1 Tax=Colletotrichum incanum TaxID=1573173 RepID=A0A162NF26_COLIC|nr:leucine rich repeat domain containing protein [Colletotrichum incanum]OHW90911.1 hypothetical protein CSPAE12_10452 [Colletotrichum incanum]